MYISEVYTTPPETYENETEKLIYSFLTKSNIEFHRVDTEEAIEMDMCTIEILVEYIPNLKAQIDDFSKDYFINFHKTGIHFSCTSSVRAVKYITF